MQATTSDGDGFCHLRSQELSPVTSTSNAKFNIEHIVTGAWRRYGLVSLQSCVVATYLLQGIRTECS